MYVGGKEPVARREVRRETWAGQEDTACSAGARVQGYGARGARKRRVRGIADKESAVSDPIVLFPFHNIYYRNLDLYSKRLKSSGPRNRNLKTNNNRNSPAQCG